VTGTTSGCIVLDNGGLKTSGIIGGGQAGYLTPFNLGGSLPLMVGGEVDLEGSGISGTQNLSAPLPLVGFSSCTTCSFTASQSINWLASLRVRVGVPVDNFLIYGTAGVMFGGVQSSQRISDTANSGFYAANAKTTLAGPTVGGGVEMLLPGPWSARLEALYYDLGSMRTVAEPMNGAAVNFSDAKTFGFRGAIVRLGINLKLGDVGFNF
jgi:outer membrane immunogenic protein